CDKCRSESIIFQKYSGMHLCHTHFEGDVHRKIRETLRETKIFAPKAKVAIALNGGKDSSTLLYVLNHLFSYQKDIQLIAILIDEGIKSYRPNTLAEAKSLAERLDVPYVVKSFQEAFGVATDEIASMERGPAPCNFCGVLRKNLLNQTARELGADALATGHNLDDEAQTILLNYLRGDIDRLFRLQPPRSQPGMVPWIKPLRRLPEREVALYAIIHKLFNYDSGSCPYIQDAMSLEAKNLLNDFEDKHPGTKYSLLRSFKRIIDMLPDSNFQAQPCQKCGESCSNGFCQSCQILTEITQGKAFKCKC
ncbi:MAG: TIGR00269 family protein, partial [Methanotrichaceae archaeon]|nr:TIGR00269 family protein [Methanotrichaceae archaeon]